MAEPGQVVGGRQPARPRRRRPALACRCGPAGDRTSSRAPGPGRRGTARPSGSTPHCRAWRGCRRSRTGGSRPARGSPPAGCPRPAARHACSWRPPGRARARPGCSPRPGTRRCTAAADRRRPDGARGPARRGNARAADQAARVTSGRRPVIPPAPTNRRVAAVAEPSLSGYALWKPYASATPDRLAHEGPGIARHAKPRHPHPPRPRDRCAPVSAISSGRPPCDLHDDRVTNGCLIARTELALARASMRRRRSRDRTR